MSGLHSCGFKMFGGESVYRVFKNVDFRVTPQASTTKGVACLSNFRLVLCSSASSESLERAGGELTHTGRFHSASHFDLIEGQASGMLEVSIPLANIQKIELIRPHMTSIGISCKDYRRVVVEFEASSQCPSSSYMVGELAGALKNEVFRRPWKACAFVHVLSMERLRDGWNIYNIEKEFQRLGLVSKGWRMYSDDYELVPSYPRTLVIPAPLSDSEIMSAASYRSMRRIPCVTWRCPATGAVLARSSQPMAGITGHTNDADRKLLELLRVHGDPEEAAAQETPREFWIVDARKPLAAAANRLFQGKGSESAKVYKHTFSKFCGIENIHQVRSSLAAFMEELDRVGDDVDQLENCLARMPWHRYLQSILEGSVFVAEKLQLQSCSVLVHCSDGWDRTTQLCATAQLMLDPYYRTLEGFVVLVEKEWLSFGHKFHDRCGHDLLNNPENAPVFLQWLEVVSVLLKQFPAAFEFCSSLLVCLADHAYSCAFGTFLGNSEQERSKTYEVRGRTESVWTYIFCQSDLYVNPSFESTEKPLWPCTDMSEMCIWRDYFHRDCPSVRHREKSDQCAASGSGWRNLAESVSQALASISPTKRRRCDDDILIPTARADCLEVCGESTTALPSATLPHIDEFKAAVSQNSGSPLRRGREPHLRRRDILRQSISKVIESLSPKKRRARLKLAEKLADDSMPQDSTGFTSPPPCRLGSDAALSTLRSGSASPVKRDLGANPKLLTSRCNSASPVKHKHSDNARLFTDQSKSTSPTKHTLGKGQLCRRALARQNGSASPIKRLLGEYPIYPTCRSSSASPVKRIPSPTLPACQKADKQQPTRPYHHVNECEAGRSSPLRRCHTSCKVVASLSPKKRRERLKLYSMPHEAVSYTQVLGGDHTLLAYRSASTSPAKHAINSKFASSDCPARLACRSTSKSPAKHSISPTRTHRVLFA